MKKVILADDHPVVRKGMKEIFLFETEAAGIEVQFDMVENGEELVTRVLADSYDLAITDQNMPFLTGLKACKQIRAENPVIPVYIYSLNDYIARHYTEYGATGYFMKSGPDIVGVLNKIIETHLKFGKTHQDMQ